MYLLFQRSRQCKLQIWLAVASSACADSSAADSANRADPFSAIALLRSAQYRIRHTTLLRILHTNKTAKNGMVSIAHPGGVGSVQRPCCFTPAKSAAFTQLTAARVQLRSFPDAGLPANAADSLGVPPGICQSRRADSPARRSS
jgi:hypothetical protein